MNTPDRACVYNDVVITTPTPTPKEAKRLSTDAIAELEQQPRDCQIEALKAWCMRNYNVGADTMIECWDDGDYNSLFYPAFDAPDEELFRSGDGVKSFAEAFNILFNVVSVYAERQADANFHRSQG